MKNNRTLLITLIIIVALFIGAVVIIPQISKKTGNGGSETTSEVDLSKYDTTKFIDATDDNGQIADHVKGDATKAKLLIFEYADYQCSACALFSPWIDELVEEYKGEVAFVFRAYPLTSIHPNAIAAASAVGRRSHLTAGHTTHSVRGITGTIAVRHGRRQRVRSSACIKREAARREDRDHQNRGQKHTEHFSCFHK